MLGTSLIGSLLQTRLYQALIVMPLLMAAIGVAWSYGSPFATTAVAGTVGPDRHRRAGRLVDLAEQSASR